MFIWTFLEVLPHPHFGLSDIVSSGNLLPADSKGQIIFENCLRVVTLTLVTLIVHQKICKRWDNHKDIQTIPQPAFSLKISVQNIPW